LRILHLEDDDKDAELIQATLESDGIACNTTRVDTPGAFRAALSQGGFDLILVDYTLPNFDGISALKLVKEITPEVPFIFVSGTLGEEVAIEALKLGATDYVSKTRLSRIVPSVRRAIREAEERLQLQIAEKKLRESEAYLADAQKLSQTGSWALNLVREIRYCSEECYRVLGFDPKERLPGFDEFLLRVHPEDRALVKQRYEKSLRDKEDFELDYRVAHPATGIRSIHAVGHAVLGKSGELVELVGTVIDVTERKRAEEELQQLGDLVPQIIVVLGPDGKRIHANRFTRDYTGLTLEEYLFSDVISRVVHPEDADGVSQMRERAFAGREPFEHEARLRGNDGIYRWFLFRFSPLINNGSVIRWYGTATEIESRKQKEDQVRKENVRLEERTRIAQELHDTLLQTFISASMQLTVALERVDADFEIKPRLDRVLEIMNQGVREGRKTIETLRSADSHPLDLVLDLSRVPEELATQNGIDFRVSVGGRQRPMQAVIRHEIYRIGREALVNAFRHSRAKRIEFHLEYAEGDLRLQVRDDGCGIDPEVLRVGRKGHWGLLGMRERANNIGGELRISSDAHNGTDIHLSVPANIAFQFSAFNQQT